jgi:hypothetical protein
MSHPHPTYNLINTAEEGLFTLLEDHNIDTSKVTCIVATSMGICIVLYDSNTGTLMQGDWHITRLGSVKVQLPPPPFDLSYIFTGIGD